MRESRWLSATKPKAMLEYLRDHGSDRKCRLLTCGFYRVVFKEPVLEQSDQVVEIAEKFADGAATEEERRVGCGAAMEHIFAITREGPRLENMLSMRKRGEAWKCLEEERSTILSIPTAAPGLGKRVSEFFRMTREKLRSGVWYGKKDDTVRCGIIRCVFGNPFRPVSADPVWLTSPVLDLARAMYESRDFAAMPILADALEEAGCDNADVLAHCRGDGPHVRGCWVVDLVLGKA
jgi:hypothetical protein